MENGPFQDPYANAPVPPPPEDAHALCKLMGIKVEYQPGRGSYCWKLTVPMPTVGLRRVVRYVASTDYQAWLDVINDLLRERDGS